MPKTDIIVGVLVLFAVINGLRAGVVARVFAWLGVAAGFLLLPYVVPRVSEWFIVADTTRALLLRVAVGAATVIGCALLGTVIGRVVRIGVRFTPLSLLDRLGGVVFSLAVIALGMSSVLNAAARLPGTMGDDVRSSYSYAQLQRLWTDSLNLFDGLNDDLFNDSLNDSAVV